MYLANLEILLNLEIQLCLVYPENQLPQMNLVCLVSQVFPVLLVYPDYLLLQVYLERLVILLDPVNLEFPVRPEFLVNQLNLMFPVFLVNQWFQVCLEILVIL